MNVLSIAIAGIGRALVSCPDAGWVERLGGWSIWVGGASGHETRQAISYCMTGMQCCYIQCTCVHVCVTN